MNFLEENKKYWNRFAQEDRMASTDFNVFKKLTENLFKNFEGKIVLDFGCGTGRVYPLFIENNVEYFGVDIEPKVLDLFRNKYPEAKFSLIDGMNIPVENESKDIIWCWSVFTHYPLEDVKKILKEMKRILKKEGKIYFSYIISTNSEEDYEETRFFTHRKEKIENLLDELNLKFKKIDIIFPEEGFMLKQILMECIK